jgi:hypothetical protein
MSLAVIDGENIFAEVANPDSFIHWLASTINA